MEAEVAGGHVSGKNINPFIIGNYSGQILENYGLYMKSFDKKTDELTKLKKSEKFCSFLTSQLGVTKSHKIQSSDFTFGLFLDRWQIASIWFHEVIKFFVLITVQKSDRSQLSRFSKKS